MEAFLRHHQKAIVAALAALLVGMASLDTSTVRVEAQTPSLCNVSVEDLKTCKPFVMLRSPNRGPVAKPSGPCCTALAKANVPCLCSYGNSTLLPTLGIDPKRAMQLPRRCGLKAHC
ncbi:putative lipid-transfer protein DIR1 [Malania oleifera]|uniref:putative lipid-transfer protein DIR1 n=1 Tax=Malania oleifera TaxID=397392 RepID=UPI0025AE5B3B|nr:putative lipid-transfer protein DIR1 [Malania oleifera]